MNLPFNCYFIERRNILYWRWRKSEVKKVSVLAKASLNLDQMGSFDTRTAEPRTFHASKRSHQGENRVD